MTMSTSARWLGILGAAATASSVAAQGYYGGGYFGTFSSTGCIEGMRLVEKTWKEYGAFLLAC